MDRVTSQRAGEQAFTLLETIVALLILAIGLLALAELFIASTYTNSFAYSESVATKAAEDVLESLRSAPNFSDPRLAIGGTINSANVAGAAACATGCVADQNHVMGVSFVPVLDPGGRTSHYAMNLCNFDATAGSEWSKRQFEVRWQVIGYPAAPPAAGVVTVLPFNAYDDAFPLTPPNGTPKYNVFPTTPPDANGQTAVVVVVRVIPVGAKNAARLAKRVQLATTIARPN